MRAGVLLSRGGGGEESEGDGCQFKTGGGGGDGFLKEGEIKPDVEREKK